MSKEGTKDGSSIPLSELPIAQDLLGASLSFAFLGFLGQHVLAGGFSFAVHVWFGVLAVFSILWLFAGSYVLLLLARRRPISLRQVLVVVILTVVCIATLLGFLRAHRREPPKMTLVIRVSQAEAGMPKVVSLRREFPQLLEGLQPQVEAKFDATRHSFEFTDVRGGEWWLVPQPEEEYPRVGPILLPPHEGGIHEISNILPMEPMNPQEPEEKSASRATEAPASDLVARPTTESSQEISSITESSASSAQSQEIPSEHPASTKTPAVGRKRSSASLHGSTTRSPSDSIDSHDRIPEGFSESGSDFINEVQARNEVDNAKRLRQRDPAGAEAIFRRVIQKFPNTKAAKEAQSEIDHLSKGEESNED